MPTATHQGERSRDAWVLSALIIVALIVRVVRIGTVPGNLMLDEADNALDAYRILAGRGDGVTGLDWSQSPLFNMYILAGCITVFGDTVSGIRSMAGLLSTVSIVPFFLIARRQVSRSSAACAALLLSTSLWYLHFSRTAWINMTAPLFALCTVYFLTRALQQGRWRDYVLTGACVTLGTYGYAAGRSIPIAVAAASPVAVMLRPKQWQRTLAGIGVTLGLVAVLFAPHVWRVAQSAEPGRMSNVSILSAQEYLGESNRAIIVLQQIGRNLAGFLLLDPREMGRGLWAHYLPPGRTVLDHGTGVLFWIGLIAGLLRWRAVFLWWLFLLVPILTVQVFSTQTPDAGRGLVVAPFMYLFVALGIESVVALRQRWPAPLVVGGVLAAVVLLAGANLYTYATWIQSAQALGERHPAVELHEFRAWSRLQRAALADGHRGFVVSAWRERIDNNGCKNGTLHGPVCRHTDLLNESVENRAFKALAVDQDTDAAKRGPDARETMPRVARPAVRASAGASVAERDDARRRDLARLADAFERVRATGEAYPSTGGLVQSLCFYGDDAGCRLHAFIDPIPVDPRGVGLDHGYWYWSDGSSYSLYAVLEGAAEPQERCSERPEHIGLPGEVICRRGP